MIGRASLGNPWIFREIIEFINSGNSVPKPSPKEKITTMLKHLDFEIQDKGEKLAVLEMRKHFGWYMKNMPDAAKIRKWINEIESKEELVKLIKEYFSNL